ncbi:MAG: polynucleotide adenylyltransferase [Candidatus Atribacteria bacterium]|nr:polynucleotide adenylyltransferase [Candidatus Atribacteria bacterium]MCK4309288.1 polynucleotide adenylyltransferase [Candidatus Atribacteria bacterium]
MFKKEKNLKLNLKIEIEDIDPVALYIIKKLNDKEFSAFIVGGCIRNLIMREKPYDWDITTRATAEEIADVFKDYKVVQVGRKFGSVTVIINHINYQVSTFKRSKSTCIPNLFEDLRRRDFTINTLAWREGEGVIDYFNGLEDIKQKIIRGVEDPKERIKEDPLRMLRAVRLACELDFKIEENTLAAIHKNSELIQKISSERIRDEFTKILLSNYPRRGFKLLYRLGLLRFIVPELQKCVGIYRENFREGKDLFEHILGLVGSLPPDLNLRLSVLLSNIKSIARVDEKKEIIVKILQRIRFKNAVVKKVTILTKEDWQAINFSQKKKIIQLASRIGMENLKDIWELKKALIKESQSSEKTKSVEIEIGENNVKEILQERPPAFLKDLAVNGKDLFELGYKEGKEIGLVLKELLNLVLEKPALNQKKILLTWVKEKNSL